ncbi:MAG TPA: response regulator [Vicinamibacterales bacterium]|jgi:CheY-like chemotaxis protein
MSESGRVLLVEDDKFLRRACEASLRQRGFEVTSATEGEEGLRLAREPPLPDVILLDLLMPKLPGIEVLRALKQDPATAGIPVVIVSNSSREDDKNEAVKLGAVGYYVKANLSLKDLAAHIRKLMADHAGAR